MTYQFNREEMERRRLEAAHDLNIGMTQTAVARKYGVSCTSTSRWARILKDGGMNALRRRKVTGRRCRLKDHQISRLRYLLTAPDNWTTKKIAALIEAAFGVKYHSDHIGVLLRRYKITVKREAPRGEIS